MTTRSRFCDANKFASLLIMLSVMAGTRVAAQNNDKPLYQDYTKPVEARVKDLISRMTLEEKAEYLNHVGPDIPRFAIKSDKWNQSLHGSGMDPSNHHVPGIYRYGSNMGS